MTFLFEPGTRQFAVHAVTSPLLLTQKPPPLNLMFHAAIAVKTIKQEGLLAGTDHKCRSLNHNRARL